VLAAYVQGAEAAPPDSEQVTRIRLHPMAEMRPALKYQLLPPLFDRRPGNAAVWWNRIPGSQPRFFENLYKAGGLWDKVENWLKMPLGEAQERQFRQREPEIARLDQNSLFSDMDHAARFATCDWQQPIGEGRLITMRFPEMDQARSYGRLLRAKARLEIAEGKYDRAVRTFQTGFALARHSAQGQTLVHAITGTSVASMMSDQIEQFVQQPDAPNLYWALASLPCPLVDFRTAYEAEMSLYFNFPELKDLDSKRLSAEQWRELLYTFVNNFAEFSVGRSQQPSLLAVLAAMQGYPSAKRYLIEHGRPAAEVEAMPVAQVVLLYSVRQYQETSDDLFKYVFLPRTQTEKRLAEAESRLTADAVRRREIIPLASLLLPAVGSVRNAETRAQWSLARLRILEALRIYAAAHQGRLPDRLDDIGEVPVPLNPYNDQPFEYHRDGARAVLTSPAGPRGERWRYEITMSVPGEK
jgi:hypothetical protein